MVTKAKVLSLVSVLVALIASTIFAQDYRGRIQGTVSDPSSAVLSEATVTLTNVNTGIAVVHKTNENGRYLFDLVEPGMYRVSVEAPGFKKFAEENISLATRG